MVAGSTHEWFRYLDVASSEEAVAELERWATGLERVYEDLMRESRRLNDAPETSLAEAVGVARATLGEAIDVLHDCTRRFRAGEDQVA